MTNKDREAFEAWVNRDGGYLNDSDDTARVARTIAWQAWKAATAAERERDEAICAEFSQDAYARYRASRREYDDGQCDAANALADKIRSGE